MNSKRHVVKRFFAIILTVMMVVTLLPLTAFPAFDVFADEEINSLSVTIPTTGLKDLTFEDLEAQITTDNEHVSVYGMSFVTNQGSSSWAGERVIGDLSNYICWSLYLKADSGYSFVEHPTASVNNQQATICSAGGGIINEGGDDVSLDATSPYIFCSILMFLDSIITEGDATDVAQIGSDKYASLDDAFAAAKNGDIIELLSDVELDHKISVTTAGITLDLGDYTIRNAESFADFFTEQHYIAVEHRYEDWSSFGLFDVNLPLSTDSFNLVASNGGICVTQYGEKINIISAVILEKGLLNVDGGIYTGSATDINTQICVFRSHVLNPVGSYDDYQNSTLNISNATIDGGIAAYCDRNLYGSIEHAGEINNCQVSGNVQLLDFYLNDVSFIPGKEGRTQFTLASCILSDCTFDSNKDNIQNYDRGNVQFGNSLMLASAGYGSLADSCVIKSGKYDVDAYFGGMPGESVLKLEGGNFSDYMYFDSDSKPICSDSGEGCVEYDEAIDLEGYKFINTAEGNFPWAVVPDTNWTDTYLDISAGAEGYTVVVKDPLNRDIKITKVTVGNQGVANPEITNGTGTIVDGCTLYVPYDTGKTDYSGEMYSIFVTVGEDAKVFYANLRTVEVDPVTYYSEDFALAYAEACRIKSILQGVPLVRDYEPKNVITSKNLFGIQSGDSKFGYTESAYNEFIAAVDAVEKSGVFGQGNTLVGSEAELADQTVLLNNAIAAFKADFDVVSISFSGKNKLNIVWSGDHPEVSYIKGVYPSMPASGTSLYAGEAELANGVYTFFIKDDSFTEPSDISWPVSQIRYVVVGVEDDETTDACLIESLKTTVVEQIGAAAEDIFTSGSDDLDVLVKDALAAYAKANKPIDGPGHDTPFCPDPVVIENPEFKDYIEIVAHDDGTFTYSAKNGAKIEYIHYALNVAEGQEASAGYYPVKPSGNTLYALAGNAKHTFKAMVLVNGKHELYYGTCTSLDCDTPAAIRMSTAVGVLKRDSNKTMAAYCKGSFESLEAAVSEENVKIYYFPLTTEGMYLDGRVFDTGEYTFFFMDASGNCTVQYVSL